MSSNAVKIADLIGSNPYVGRGIIAGTDPTGKYAVTAYFIMGRSVNSRNRVFAVRDDGAVITKAFDESKVTDPSLIIYAAMREHGGRLITTNGDQTDTVYDGLTAGISFEESLDSRCFEPDAPNYTPRISALQCFENGYSYKMSVLKCPDGSGINCDRCTYAPAPAPGIGHFIHTYEGDGNPLPSFRGEPERIAVSGSAEEFAQEIWNALNADNRISLVVRFTDIAGGDSKQIIINKNVRSTD